MKYLFLFILFFFAVHLPAQEELKGYWLRVDDRVQNPTDSNMPTQDSTILEVTYLNGEFVGILLRIPQTSIDYGYAVGQVKWKNIVKKEKDTFELDGLLMEQGTSSKFDVISYLKVHIRLTDKKNSILLWTDSQGDRFNWAKQKWIRLPLV